MKTPNTYEETIVKVAFDSVSAEDFFSKIPQKELFATFIPKWDTKWRSMFKSLWYFALGNSENLILVHNSSSKNVKKVSVLTSLNQVYMWKKWKSSTQITNILKKSKMVRFVEREFNWISAELPFLRIIWDYQTLTFMEISEFVDLEELAILFQSIKDCAKFVFISDFASQEEMELFADFVTIDENWIAIKNHNNAFMTLFFMATAENFWHNVEILLHDPGPKKNKAWIACVVF